MCLFGFFRAITNRIYMPFLLKKQLFGKSLRSSEEPLSLLYVVLEILQFVHEISSFPEVIYKRGVLKNFSKFSDKQKKQSSGSVLSKYVYKNVAKFIEKASLLKSLF